MFQRYKVLIRKFIICVGPFLLLVSSNVFAGKLLDVLKSVAVANPYNKFSANRGVADPEVFNLKREKSLFTDEIKDINNIMVDAVKNGDVSKAAFTYLLVKQRYKKERDNVILPSVVSVFIPLAIPWAIYNGVLWRQWGKLKTSLRDYLACALPEHAGFQTIDEVKELSPIELGKVSDVIEKNGYSSASFKEHVNLNHTRWASSRQYPVSDWKKKQVLLK